MYEVKRLNEIKQTKEVPEPETPGSFDDQDAYVEPPGDILSQIIRNPGMCVIWRGGYQ